MLQSKNLQRRYGLRQDTASNRLLEHQHALFDEKIYVFGGGLPYDYTATGATEYGNCININPFSILYAVKAEVFLTCEFDGLGSGENFYLEFALRDNGIDIHTANVTETETETQSRVFPYVLDVSDVFTRYFQLFRTGDAYMRVQVSNPTYPLKIFGAYLKVTTYREDTYGDYTTPFNEALILSKPNERKKIQEQINKYAKLPYLFPLIPH